MRSLGWRRFALPANSTFFTGNTSPKRQRGTVRLPRWRFELAYGMLLDG